MYDYGTADANRDHYGIVSLMAYYLMYILCVWRRLCVCVGRGEYAHYIVMSY